MEIPNGVPIRLDLNKQVDYSYRIMKNKGGPKLVDLEVNRLRTISPVDLSFRTMQEHFLPKTTQNPKRSLYGQMRSLDEAR